MHRKVADSLLAQKKWLHNNISPPALLALIGYAVLVAVVLIPLDMYVWDEDSQRYQRIRYSLSHRLFMVLYLSLPIFLTVYNIQCVMTGDCRTWSWILAIVSFAMASLFVVQNFTLVLSQ